MSSYDHNQKTDYGVIVEIIMVSRLILLLRPLTVFTVWDRKFLNKLKDLDIQVKGYKRFKDDTNIMLRPVDRKLKYEENEMVMKTTEEMEKENKFEKDEVTMKTIQTVAEQGTLRMLNVFWTVSGLTVLKLLAVHLPLDYRF